VAAYPHNAVSTIIRLTAENSKDGVFQGGTRRACGRHARDTFVTFCG